MKIKRITALLLAIITIVISVNVLVSAQNYLPFTDVKSTDWFYNDVYLAYGRGLINGKSRDMFAPNDNLKYSEAVKLAACMRIAYFDEEPLVVSGKFWYDVYVDYCKFHGIIGEDYAWDAYVTRGDFMEIFAAALPDNALKAINAVADGSIPDVPTNHKNAEAIYKLYRAGIVQGSDSAHRCNPVSQVKRSEVAAILTRMMYEYARLEFSLYLEGEKDSGGNAKIEEDFPEDRNDYDDEPQDDKPSKNDKDNKIEDETKGPEKDEKTEEVTMEKFPWEEPGAKQPKDYTFEEYEALPIEFQVEFVASFEREEEFDLWYKEALNLADPMPWDKLGAKQPKDYTFAEYEALTPKQQIAFFESFGSPEAFDAWLTANEPDINVEETGGMPWDKPGAKQPKDYTFAEYETLTSEQQVAFFESFGSPEAFDAWLTANEPDINVEETGDMPWDKPGAKQPKNYTFAEYEALTAEQQVAFFESFSSVEGFDVWLTANQPEIEP